MVLAANHCLYHYLFGCKKDFLLWCHPLVWQVLSTQSAHLFREDLRIEGRLQACKDWVEGLSGSCQLKCRLLHYKLRGYARICSELECFVRNGSVKAATLLARITRVLRPNAFI